MNVSGLYNSQGSASAKHYAAAGSAQANDSYSSFADCLDKATGSQKAGGKSISGRQPDGSFNFSLAGKAAVPESGRSENIGATGIYGDAAPGVMDAWNRATRQTGYNPLVDEEGKLVGSSLMASYMEMEYRLSQEHGPIEARKRMSEIFSDPEATRQLVTNALERASNPLTNDQSEEQLEKERSFYQAYLSIA